MTREQEEMRVEEISMQFKFEQCKSLLLVSSHPNDDSFAANL